MSGFNSTATPVGGGLKGFDDVSGIRKFGGDAVRSGVLAEEFFAQSWLALRHPEPHEVSWLVSYVTMVTVVAQFGRGLVVEGPTASDLSAFFSTGGCLFKRRIVGCRRKGKQSVHGVKRLSIIKQSERAKLCCGLDGGVVCVRDVR